MSPEFLKNKKFMPAFFLSALLLFLAGLYIYVRYYELPEHKDRLASYNDQVEDLQKQIDRFYDVAGLDKVMQDYEEGAEKVKIFMDARNEVFIFSDDGDYDFFPPLLQLILPAITKHLHGEVELEGISINEKAEVVIPVYAPSYSVLSKQYASFKQAFENEPDTLLKDIKLNSFTTQEIEILERGDRRNFVQTRKKVAKATIVAALNPEFFTKSRESDLEDDYDFDFGLSNKKKPVFQRIANVFSIIGANMKKDIDSVFHIEADGEEDANKDEDKSSYDVADELRTEQEELSEDVNEYYEISEDSETGKKNLKIKTFGGQDSDFYIEDETSAKLTAFSALLDDGQRNIIAVGDGNGADKFYFDMKKGQFIAVEDIFFITLEDGVINIKWKNKPESDPAASEPTEDQVEKKLVTAIVPSFNVYGSVSWVSVPKKMSEFLAAGKKLTVDDLEIDPYKEYSDEELTGIAVKMMKILIDKSPTKAVQFHNKTFDMSEFGDTVDLVKLNTAG